MPQTHLFRTTGEMEGVRLTLLGARPGVREHLQAAVEIRRTDHDWTTYTVISLVGIESDFLSTLASEVVSAWAYGETAKQVQYAALSVKKQAKAHRESHSM